MAREPVRNPGRRQALLLVLFFLIGLALALLFSWGRLQIMGVGAVEEEYVALVAALYEREHLLTNAQQRLAALGSENMAAAVARIAAEFPDKYPRRQHAAANLQVLAQDLQRLTGAQPPAGSPAAEQATSFDDWLGTALALFAGAAVLGGLVFAVRSLRPRRGPSRMASRYARTSPPSRPRQAPVAPSWKRARDADLDDGFSQVVSPPRPLAEGVVSEPRPLVPTDEAEESAAAAPPAAPAADWPSSPSRLGRQGELGRSMPTSHPVRPTAPPLAESLRPTGVPRPLGRGDRAAGSGVFDCFYRLGDDPYDQIHAVADPVSRVAVGACGVSSALSLEGTGGRYYAFTIWLHDYLATDEISSVGLVSKWAEEAKAQQLRSWAAREGLKKVVAAAENLPIRLETANLLAVVTVSSFDYAEDLHLPRYGCFSQLHVTFRVTLK